MNTNQHVAAICRQGFARHEYAQTVGNRVVEPSDSLAAKWCLIGAAMRHSADTGRELADIVRAMLGPIVAVTGMAVNEGLVQIPPSECADLGVIVKWLSQVGDECPTEPLLQALEGGLL